MSPKQNCMASLQALDHFTVQACMQIMTCTIRLYKQLLLAHFRYI